MISGCTTDSVTGGCVSTTGATVAELIVAATLGCIAGSTGTLLG